MADWYVSSTAYAALPQFIASNAYTVGQIIRPLTPVANQAYAFRCTTAGTSSTEPAWTTAAGNNQTITSGGATFTNVSGQSTYGWGAVAGTLWSMSFNGSSNRPIPGDRLFVSSDHAETLPNNSTLCFGNTFGFGLIQIISVNRAGSVPPVVVDALAGANLTVGTGNFVLESSYDHFWQGLTFTIPGTAGFIFFFNSGAQKSHYLKNCSFIITNNNSGTRFSTNTVAKVIFDNTTIQFGHTGQAITNNYGLDLTWINTSSAIVGATVPTTLFIPVNLTFSLIACRGVDLSAITGTLVGSGSIVGSFKALLDSCKIASGVTRLQATNSVNGQSMDEVELINCFDGTNVINERHTPAGDITTDRTTYLTSGGADDFGNYSFKLVSSSRSDFAVMPLDCFAFDIENTLTGTSHTANVEVLSSASLNNTDIRLLIEYMGNSGSPVASMADSLASVLTPSAALPSSTNTWIGPTSTTWNSGDQFSGTFTLSGGNLVATSTGAAGMRAVNGFSTGKFYFEVTVNTWGFSGTGPGIALASANTNTTGVSRLDRGGSVTTNGTVQGSGVLGGRGSGDIIGIAVDLGAQLIWYRVSPSGSWNAGGTANPATGIGGYSISTIAGQLFPFIWANGNAEVLTANFGASAFSGTAPSGFVGWSGTPTSNQLLQATFTPQRIGRLRGIVRLGKPSATVWVNPQIKIT